jgi:hypothetical protein
MTAPATKRAWRNRNAGLPDDWQRTATRRYPTGPIVELLTARLGPVMVVAADVGLRTEGATDARMGAAVGVAGSTFEQARRRGTISEITADRWATALGLHPAALWPEWWQVSA